MVADVTSTGSCVPRRSGGGRRRVCGSKMSRLYRISEPLWCFQAHFSGEHRTGKVFSPCISLFVTTSTYRRTTMMKTPFTQRSGIHQVHPCARVDTSIAGLRGKTKPNASDIDSMGLGDDFDSALCDVLAQLPYLIGSSAVC